MGKIIFLFAFILHFIFSVTGYCAAPKKEGTVEEYYSSGVLKSKTNYKNDKKNGVEEIYDETGRMEYKSKYVKGEMVSSFAFEPVRNLGPFRFLVDIRLWGGVLAAGVLLWFLFVKVMLKGKT